MLRTGFCPGANVIKKGVEEWVKKFIGRWSITAKERDNNNRGPHDSTNEGVDRNNKGVSFCVFHSPHPTFPLGAKTY
jgi:hypothetical protein